MSSRSVTPVKQITKDQKTCPGAPARKTSVFNPGNLTVIIPPFEGDFTDPRDQESKTVMCKTPKSNIRLRDEERICPDAPIKKTRSLNEE